MNPLLAIAAIAILAIPTVHAEPGDGDAYIGLPHDILLDIGTNEVPIFVGAQAECEAGFPAPSPLRVRLTSSPRGPDDGDGPAWTFEQTEWTIDWTQEGDDYAIDRNLKVNVTGHGYGGKGYAGEISMATQAVQEDTCSAQGFTIPARGGHAHISIGARPGHEDAPAAFAGLLVLLVLAAVRRR